MSDGPVPELSSPVRSRPGSIRYPEPPPPLPARIRITGGYFELLGGLTLALVVVRGVISVVRPESTSGLGAYSLQQILLGLAVSASFLWFGRMLRAGRRLGAYVIIGSVVALSVAAVLDGESLGVLDYALALGVIGAILSTWRWLK